jgi:hypothetical protein
MDDGICPMVRESSQPFARSSMSSACPRCVIASVRSAGDAMEIQWEMPNGIKSWVPGEWQMLSGGVAHDPRKAPACVLYGSLPLLIFRSPMWGGWGGGGGIIQDIPGASFVVHNVRPHWHEQPLSSSSRKTVGDDRSRG